MHQKEERSAAADTERAVLGALYIGAPWGPSVQRLQPHMFRCDIHRLIFQAMQLLRADGVQALDAALLHRKLLEMGANVSGTLADLLHRQLHDLAATTANVEHHAAALLEEWRGRRFAEILSRTLRNVESGTVPANTTLEEMQLELDAFARIAAGRTPDSRFLDASVSDAELDAKSLEKPRSLIGDGLLVEGGFMLVYGRPGIRKTWSAGLQLADALARGEPWLGIETEQSTVGVLELELPSAHMQERFRIVRGDRQATGRVHLVARPELRGPVNLLDEQHRAGIVNWVKAKGIKVLVIDALSRVHQVDENSADKFGQVLAAVDLLREEAGCAVVLLHHEPKGRRESNGNTTDDDLDAARGTSRLQSDPQTLLRLKRSKGQLVLVAAKVNLGPTPEPVWLRETEAGPLELADPPLDDVELGDANRERIEAACPAEGKLGALAVEVAAATGLSPQTVRQRLKELTDRGRLTRTKEGQRYRYNRAAEASC